MGEKFNISNLNLYYGDFHALKDVDLSINEKEITAFIGPSGCGKSTFLKCLNRMNDLVQGCKITGQVLLGRGRHLQRHGRESAAQACRHGIPEAESVPDEHLRQYRIRTAHARHPFQDKAG